MSTHEYSCMLCKKRKVRCDKANPCSGCTEAGVNCVKSTRAPYSRRKKATPGKESYGFRQTESQPIIVENGKPKIGQRVMENGNLLQSSEDAGTQSEIKRSSNDTPNFEQSLWVGLTNEFQDPRGSKILTPPDEGSHGDPLSDPAEFIFNSSTTVLSLKDSYPQPTHAYLLWQAFLKNVNPLSKLIHAPTLQTQVHDANRNFESVSKPVIALLFSIYAAAITSMNEEDCHSTMGEPRQTLLCRYITSTQHALSGAGFIHSLDLTVLQAYVLYILSVRLVYQPHAVWILTGIAVRMGQRLKLHIEKESPKLSILESEIRRRIWWQILFIDSRSAQLSGSFIPGIGNVPPTSLPSNLNDEDLSPEMTDTPVAHKGATEMIFCLLKYEFGIFLYSNGKKMNNPEVSLAEKDRTIDELENHLECNYLRYCDPAIPLHLVSAGGARSAICKMRLVAHHPSQWPDKGASMSQAERELVFATSIKMVEYNILGSVTKAVEHFLWHIKVYFQLDAFVFMLIESRNQLFGPLADKAWHLVSETYKYHPELISDQTNELYVAVGDLALRAWDARAAEITRRTQQQQEPPSFISVLRAQKKYTVFRPTPSDFSIQENTPKALHHDLMLESTTGSADGINSHTQHNHTNHFGEDIYGTGSDKDIPADWDSMDWEYWNQLLESNMTYQSGDQRLLG